MLLAIDIGNTHTVIGIFKKENLISSWRLSSAIVRTEDEIFHFIKLLCEHNNIDIDKIKSIGIASVVPNLTFAYELMSKKYFDIEPIIISNELNLGIKILYEDPNSVGADRICNAVAVFKKYGGPSIVIDFGTAITYDVIAKNGDYLGGAITLGVETISSVLHIKAAKLPKVELHFPNKSIGKNTVESIQSGILFGIVDGITGMIKRIESEIGKANIIATGGNSKMFKNKISQIQFIEENLVLEGIKIITGKNLKSK